MSVKLKAWLFAGVIALQAGSFVMIISNHLAIADRGQLGYLAVDFYDPYNPLLGRYLQLSHALNQRHRAMPPSHRFAVGDAAYLLLDINSDNFVTPKGLVAEQPDSGLYLRTTIQSGWRLNPATGYRIKPMLDRYYVQEELAVRGEKLLWEITRQTTEADVSERADDSEQSKDEDGIEDEKATNEQPRMPSPRIWVELKILEGKAAMTELYVDGVPLAEVVRNAQ